MKKKILQILKKHNITLINFECKRSDMGYYVYRIRVGKEDEYCDSIAPLGNKDQFVMMFEEWLTNGYRY